VAEPNDAHRGTLNMIFKGFFLVASVLYAARSLGAYATAPEPVRMLGMLGTRAMLGGLAV